ncbi:MAG: DMT family transporter [Lentimicrobiaceae bacterium]|nr:DMT family transporter [Lentimicrobiaceae bacterium]MCO5264766.1 DMT family transporter [Lentimicrobium sp.]
MKNNVLKYYSYAVLSMLFWGLTFVWFKIAVAYYEPITIIFIRLVLSSAILLMFAWITGKYEKIERADLKWFYLLAFTQPFFYFLGESFGLKYVSSTISSAIIATIPLFSPLAAVWFTREKTNVYTWAGIIVSFAGILLMLVNRDLSLNAEPKGIALLFMAVLSAVIYSVIVKKLTHKYSALTIISRQNLIGALYFLPLFIFFDFDSFISVKPDTSLILAMLQLAVFGSCLAYLFFIIAVAQLGMVKANIFTNLIPVFTAVFAYFVLAEVFNVQKVTGIILVVMGIVVSQTKEILQLLNREHNKRKSVLKNH